MTAAADDRLISRQRTAGAPVPATLPLTARALSAEPELSGQVEPLGPGWLTVAVIIGIMAALIALGGMILSFRAVSTEMVPAFGARWAWLVPIVVDLTVFVFSGVDLVLARLDMSHPLARWTVYGATGGTVWLNYSAGGSAAGRVAHVLMPSIWVVFVELMRHVVRRQVNLATASHREPIPTARWLLSPWPTLKLWRRMVLWRINSYPRALEQEKMRLGAVAAAREMYGRFWRLRISPLTKLQINLGELGAHDLRPADVDGGAVSLAGAGVSAGGAAMVAQTAVVGMPASVADRPAPAGGEVNGTVAGLPAAATVAPGAAVPAAAAPTGAESANGAGHGGSGHRGVAEPMPAASVGMAAAGEAALREVNAAAAHAAPAHAAHAGPADAASATAAEVATAGAAAWTPNGSDPAPGPTVAAPTAGSAGVPAVGAPLPPDRLSGAPTRHAAPHPVNGNGNGGQPNGPQLNGRQRARLPQQPQSQSQSPQYPAAAGGAGGGEPSPGVAAAGAAAGAATRGIPPQISGAVFPATVLPAQRAHAAPPAVPLRRQEPPHIEFQAPPPMPPMPRRSTRESELLTAAREVERWRGQPSATRISRELGIGMPLATSLANALREEEGPAGPDDVAP